MCSIIRYDNKILILILCSNYDIDINVNISVIHYMQSVILDIVINIKVILMLNKFIPFFFPREIFRHPHALNHVPSSSMLYPKTNPYLFL